MPPPRRPFPSDPRREDTPIRTHREHAAEEEWAGVFRERVHTPQASSPELETMRAELGDVRQQLAAKKEEEIAMLRAKVAAYESEVVAQVKEKRQEWSKFIYAVALLVVGAALTSLFQYLARK